jgi:quercetin dioxygenase-like cupin family protein
MPDGTEVRITKRAAEPQREPFQLEMIVPPRSTATPPHVHPDQTDEFNIVEGSLEVLCNGEWRMLNAGDSFVIPPGVVHTYRNHGDMAARALNVHEPAGSFQEYIDQLGMLVEAGKLRRLRGPTALLHLSLLWSQHLDSMVFADRRLRRVVSLLASAARLLGLKVPTPAQRQAKPVGDAPSSQ